jgi:protein-S-isoprenylcysteine O-methyltransferase Ste14
MMKRVLFGLYGVAAYAIFVGTFLYAIGFVTGFGVPKILDAPVDGPLIPALLGDAGLLALFAVQHSVMARRWFKAWWTRIVPTPIERSTYVLFASLALITLFWHWKPLGLSIWTVDDPRLRTALSTLGALGWIQALLTTFLINHFDLFGLRQVWLHLLGRPYTKVHLATPTPYRIVRHPLYLGFLVAFWSTPTMTAGHLFFAMMTTAYILIAIQFEERDLVHEHGQVYELYRRTVPMILPSARRRGASTAVGASLIILAVGVAGGAQAPAAVPTFSRDVAPILYAHCVECHRVGEIAPMPLVTYAEVRPWARAIARKVLAGAMPPWHADAPAGTFRNERVLMPDQKDLIERWAAADAPQGDAADLPPAPVFARGWRIGQPDVILEMQEDYSVPARGTIEYENFYVPTGFTEERWVQAIEARPGNPALVHHILVYYEAAPDEPLEAPILERNRADDVKQPRTPGKRPLRESNAPSRLLATYAPGTNPQVFPLGTALRLPPGGVLRFQLHYTANGTAGTDRSRVGLIFAKDRPGEELHVSYFVNRRFTIPAGSPSEAVSTDVTFLRDATLWGLWPHTHLRGKRWSYVLELPDGRTAQLLSVPRYDFNWQTYYMFRQPLAIPKGARIVSTAWYDNSPANRANPDPTVDVKWGDQTWEEMQYTGIMYSVKRTPGN